MVLWLLAIGESAGVAHMHGRLADSHWENIGVARSLLELLVDGFNLGLARLAGPFLLEG